MSLPRVRSGAPSTHAALLLPHSVVKFHNQSLRFILLPPASEPSSLFPTLDACAAADFVLVGLSSAVEVDENAETALRAMTGSGVGASGGVIGVVSVRFPSVREGYGR